MADDPFMTSQPAGEALPPAFEARYAGECSYDSCPWVFFEAGAMIRADGLGGYECAEHQGES